MCFTGSVIPSCTLVNQVKALRAHANIQTATGCEACLLIVTRVYYGDQSGCVIAQLCLLPAFLLCILALQANFPCLHNML